MYNNVPPEIEELFLGDLGWDDQIAYGHTGHQARDILQATLAMRVLNVLDLFIPQRHHDRFWALLAAGNGGVTGSASTWVTESSPTWLPRDLNTVVARGGATALCAFLLNLPGFEERHRSPRIPGARPTAAGTSIQRCYHPDSEWADSFTLISTANERLITVTETTEPSVLRHLLEVRHSVQAVLLTRNIVLAMYPRDVCSRSMVYRAGGISNGGPFDIGHARKRATEMGYSSLTNPTLIGACETLCPGLLRRLRGGRGLGLFRWTTRTMDDLDASAYNGFMDEAFAGFAWTWGVDGSPPNIVDTNAKRAVLRSMAYASMHSDPPFAQIYQGILFATSCLEPLFVPVPLDHGISDLRTIDDLCTYTWIHGALNESRNTPRFWPPTTAAGVVFELNRLSYTLRLDNSGSKMHIFMSTNEAHAPINLALTPREEGVHSAHGDVLIMFSNNDGMTEPDAGLILAARAYFQEWWSGELY
ncbi:hypothetical protein B0H11DRAFT_2246355 [Mycena galericulata]|nr:hypothetical protein B0H11DRAFT_2246355 [Mycena galericulata]